MKIQIREQTEERLVARLAPSKWIYVFCGVAFLVVGIWTAWMFAHSTTLSLDERVVEYKRRFLGLLSTKVFRIPIEDVTDVAFDDGIQKVSGNVVVFKTTTGSYAASFVWIDATDERALLEACMQAIASRAGNVAHTEHVSVWGLGLGCVCLIFGLAIFNLLHTATIIVEPREHRMTIVHQKWLPLPKTVRLVDVRDVLRIEVKQRMVEAEGKSVNCFEVFVLQRKKPPETISSLHMLDASSSAGVKRLLDTYLQLG